MKRIVAIAVIKMCGKAVLLTVLAGIVIAILGNVNHWDTSLKYSNAFFITGCLLIIAGTSSRMAAGAEWFTFQRLHTESFRNMSVSERANFIVSASSSASQLILGLLSGILLIIISWLVTKIY